MASNAPNFFDQFDPPERQAGERRPQRRRAPPSRTPGQVQFKTDTPAPEVPPERNPWHPDRFVDYVERRQQAGGEPRKTTTQRNFFDQFDPPSGEQPGSEAGGNFFDQFDEAPSAPGQRSALGSFGPAFKLGTAQTGRALGAGLEAAGTRMQAEREEDPDAGFWERQAERLKANVSRYADPAALPLLVGPGGAATYASQRERVGRGYEQAGQALQESAESTIEAHPEWQRDPDFQGKEWTELLADPDTRYRYLSRAMGENLPVLIGGIGAALAGGVAGGPGGALASGYSFMHLAESGHSFEDLVDLAGSREEAARTAHSVGVVNGLLEMAPVGRLFAKVPGLRRAVGGTMTRKLATQPRMRRMLSEGLKQAAVEGSTEGLQEVVSNLGRQAYDENQDLFEGIGEATFIGALLGKAAGVTGQAATGTRTQAQAEAAADRRPERGRFVTRAERAEAAPADEVLGEEAGTPEDTPLAPDEGTALPETPATEGIEAADAEAIDITAPPETGQVPDASLEGIEVSEAESIDLLSPEPREPTPSQRRKALPIRGEDVRYETGPVPTEGIEVSEVEGPEAQRAIDEATPPPTEGIEAEEGTPEAEAALAERERLREADQAEHLARQLERDLAGEPLQHFDETVQSADVTRSDGTPYPTRKAAEAARAGRRIAGAQPARVEGGWVLRPAQEPAPAATAEAATATAVTPTAPPVQAATRLKRSPASTGADPDTDTLVQAVAREGGLSREAVGGDLDESLVFREYQTKKGNTARRPANAERTILPIVRARGGLTPDEMAERLSQFGYPVDGANALLQAMNDEVSGQPVRSTQRSTEALTAEREQEAEDYFERLYGEDFVIAEADFGLDSGETLDEGTLETEREIMRLMAEAGRIDPEAAEAAADTSADDAVVIRELQRIIERGQPSETTARATEAAPEAPARTRPVAAAEGEDAATRQEVTRPDLFGEDTSRQQAVADARRAKDQTRSGTRDVDLMEGGAPLFDENRRRQVDVEDVARSEPTAPAEQPESSRTPQQQAPRQPSAERIEDFGEVLEGARKHYAEAYRDRMREAGELDVVEQPLSKTWPEPDYQRLIDDGADPWVVGFVRAARDEIPPKPRKGWKLKSWAEQVRALRDSSRNLLDGEISKDRVLEALNEPKFKRLKDNIEPRIELYQAVGHDKSLKGISVSAGTYSVIDGKKLDPPRTIWSVEQKAKASAFSNWPRQLATGDTRAEAIANFKKNIDKLDLDQKASRTVSFDIYRRRGDQSWIIGKKIGRDYVDLKRFDTVEEARAYKADNHDDLVEELSKFKEIPDVRRSENEARVGVDHRNGADVTPEIFAETFGFRGVQFGNYVEGGRRQQDLNNAYDALMDMAGVLGIPPKALSLNGELGLAFGARGRGGKRAAAAHYEPGTVVINLTKGGGPGSLAHEWFHAVDNYFSRMRGEREGFLTERPKSVREGVRPEMVQAFTDLRQAINKTGIRERSRDLDRRRTKEYWGTGREMAARSFESYIIAKLKDQGQSNDYLANVVNELMFALEGAYPYPTAGEMPAIREAFDHFFDTVETRETDQGVALFSEAAAPTGLTPTQADTEIKRAIGPKAHRALFGDGGIGEIVETPEGLPENIRQSVTTGAIDRAQGVYDPRSNRVYLVASNLTPATVRGVVLHEIGVHYGIRNVMEASEYKSILAQFKRLEQDGDPAVLAALSRVPARVTNEALRYEEGIAYLAENLANRDTTLYQRVHNAIRGFLQRLGVLRYLSPEDIARVLRGNLARAEKRHVKTDAGTMLSEREGEPESTEDIRKRLEAAQRPPNYREPPAKSAPDGHFPGFDVAAESVRDYLIRNIQDRFRRLKTFQRAITEQGGEVREDTDVYLAEELFHGKAEARLKNLETRHIRPFVRALADSPIDMEQLDRYLYARHAPERNAAIEEINPKFREGQIAGSGMTNAEAAEIMREFREANQIEELERLAARIDAMNAERLRVLEQAGLESEQNLGFWREKYRHYVPLRGQPDGDGKMYPHTGRGYDVRGKESKRALGRQSRAESPVLHSIAQLEETLIRSEKNYVGRTLMQLIRENPSQHWSITEPHEHGAHVKPVFDERTREVVYRADPAFKLADDVLSVKEGGKEYYLHLNDEALARAMKNLGADNANRVVRALAGFNRFLAMVNTSLSPEFMVSNFERDLQTALINLVGEQDAQGHLRQPQKMGRKVLRDIPKALRGVYVGLRDETSTDEWAVHFREFRDAGGKIGFFGLEDIEVKRKKLARMLRESEGDMRANAQRWFREIGKLIMDANGAVENAVRLATFVEARKAGLSAPRAATLSRNLTVNFNRKGELGPLANSMYLFFNAGLQGTARMIYALKSPKVRKLMLGIMVGSFMLAELNRWIAGDDDDGENRYDKNVPDWAKERNLILMKPGGEDYFMFGLPYGYNLPFVVGETINALIHGKDKGKATAHVVATAVESFNPLGSEDSDSAVNRMLKMVSPTITDVWLQMGLNEAWHGGKIKPENLPYAVPKPESELYFNTVSRPSKAIAQTLNELTGGNEVRPGAVDVSPEHLDHLWEFFSGSAGRFIKQVVTAPELIRSPQPIPAKEIPFVRRLYGEADLDRVAANRYYEIRDEVQQVAAEYDYVRRENLNPRAFLDGHKPLLRLQPLLKSTERQLRKVYERRRHIETNTRIDERKRQEQLQRMEQEITKLRKRLISKYVEFTGNE